MDENGKPVEIVKYAQYSQSHHRGVYAPVNEVVSEHFYWLGVPFVYRIHENPDPDKMESLNQVPGIFGYHLKGYQDIHPRALQEILDQIKGTPEKVISTLTLRSLQKPDTAMSINGILGWQPNTIPISQPYQTLSGSDDPPDYERTAQW